jgi:hypothetical protein
MHKYRWFKSYAAAYLPGCRLAVHDNIAAAGNQDPSLLRPGVNRTTAGR